MTVPVASSFRSVVIPPVSVSTLGYPSAVAPKSRKDVQLIPSPHVDLMTLSLDKGVDSCPISRASAMEAIRGCFNNLDRWTVALAFRRSLSMTFSCSCADTLATEVF